MAYRIEYLRNGREIGNTPSDASLIGTVSYARAGLARHGADFVRIVDVDGDGAVVWSERRNDDPPKDGSRVGSIVPQGK